jgi:hypothetical protein
VLLLLSRLTRALEHVYSKVGGEWGSQQCALIRRQQDMLTSHPFIPAQSNKKKLFLVFENILQMYFSASFILK